MTAITWNESVPSSTSAVGLFPPTARSAWTAISLGMATEHYWPGSGGGSDASIGDLLPGASRTYVATQSQSSLPSQGIGRLFYASDTKYLLAYLSSGTYLAGTPYLSEHITAPTGVWARFTGSYTTATASGVTTITFPTPFIAAPATVHQSVNTTIWIVAAANISASAFSSFFSVVAGANTVTVTWEALGQLSSASY